MDNIFTFTAKHPNPEGGAMGIGVKTELGAIEVVTGTAIDKETKETRQCHIIRAKDLRGEWVQFSLSDEGARKLARALLWAVNES